MHPYHHRHKRRMYRFVDLEHSTYHSYQLCLQLRQHHQYQQPSNLSFFHSCTSSHRHRSSKCQHPYLEYQERQQHHQHLWLRPYHCDSVNITITQGKLNTIFYRANTCQDCTIVNLTLDLTYHLIQLVNLRLQAADVIIVIFTLKSATYRV